MQVTREQLLKLPLFVKFLDESKSSKYKKSIYKCALKLRICRRINKNKFEVDYYRDGGLWSIDAKLVKSFATNSKTILICKPTYEEVLHLKGCRLYNASYDFYKSDNGEYAQEKRTYNPLKELEQDEQSNILHF
jgi:hypothetical protein